MEFGKLTGNRQTKSKPGRTFIDAFTWSENLRNLIWPQAWTVVLDDNRDRSSIIVMRVNRDLVARPLERVFQQIAGHLIEILLLTCNPKLARHALRNGNPLVRVNFSECIDDVGNARSNPKL
jgi:hypothetical protein